MAAWSKPRVSPDWFRKELCPDGYEHAGLLKALVALAKAEKAGDIPAELREAAVRQAEDAAEDILGFDGDDRDLKARSKVLYELADLIQAELKQSARDSRRQAAELAEIQSRLEKLGVRIKDALKAAQAGGNRDEALELVALFLRVQPEFQRRLDELPGEEARPFSGFARSAAATADAFAKLQSRLAAVR